LPCSINTAYAFTFTCNYSNNSSWKSFLQHQFILKWAEGFLLYGEQQYTDASRPCPFITLMYVKMAYSLKWYEVLFTKQSTNLEWALFCLLIYAQWSGFSNSSKMTVQYNVYKQQICFKNVLSICLVAIHTLYAAIEQYECHESFLTYEDC